MTAPREPRYAYEDPAALAWTAQMFRTAHRRRLLRLAAEQAEAEVTVSGAETTLSSTDTTPGGVGHG